MRIASLGRLVVKTAVLVSVFAAHATAASALTLTVTTQGAVPGTVSVIPIGQLCNPPGGGTCQFTDIASGTEMRLMANSASPQPGVFTSVNGSAATCVLGTSTCTFVITEDSAVSLAFNPGVFPSVTINLAVAPGEVGVDNSKCQNVDPFDFSACTTYYGSGSVVTLQARAPESTAFAGFSNGTNGAAACAASPCAFTLTADSSLDATFTPCRVNLSSFGQTLTLGFNLGTLSPVQWNVWLSAQNVMVPLWSAAIPVVDPPVNFSVPLPEFPPLGTVGVLTTLVDAAEGIACSSWRTIDTGSAPASAAVR